MDADGSRVRLTTIGEALGLTALGTVIGTLTIIALRLSFGAAGLTDVRVVEIFLSRGIQLGFLITSVAYLYRTAGFSRYVQIRKPSLHDAAWVVGSIVLLAGIGAATSSLLDVLGIAVENEAGGGHESPYASTPVLWPVIFVVWFLFAAPSEELLFRGIIQGRIREAFDPGKTVVLSGVMFGLMHVPVAALSTGLEPVSSFVETFVGGMVFALAYERTGNLVVPSATHALLWSQTIVFAILGA
ncbi:CPBP family intramembrane glutamic endopeptidase [Halostella salina]|uniref:CPBP family intramembrane glutamic endopeptidase n=1 Tax=Halostella salina TaxID=1547897 RepID=UPI000EF76867|nr:CPBP family intramembrane glutamic endopeptidase [Halostella salina]